ncbi:DUF1444 family protein [Epilithonimonas lactis]|uniref:DUF1444 family protein n=1 Tax=Epilithonimonas lactis TaxID=421072 RepID=A0A085BN88_9FLAO|nr:DUF1444 family protein [Epilithonimonas lactis]KFC23933.1 hypothetical protein IO89_05080 [Epilithonimonas lactis]SEQ30761.1 Protein of unknown function [Epilithonimonas lactis]
MLTESEFSKEFANRLIQKVDGLRIILINGLEIQTEFEGSTEYRHFLNNCYSEYCRNPDEIEEIFLKYLNATDSIYNINNDININDILPVIKDRRFLQNLRELDNNFKENNVFEKYNDELYIFYVEDTETNINYLSRENVESLNIDPSKLREIAIENLLNSIEIEKHGEDGYYMLVVDGNYESSLILLDIWHEENFEVSGEIIIGIPARDLLLITGKNDIENLERLKNTIKEISEEGDHLVSEKLFEYRNGKFEAI